ncbi:hypothetical protein SSTU70S_00511 [Stutzerimonas stutzeri]
MIIFGVAFLALCTLSGLFAGELLGKLLGVPANVGGVGIAMVLLILLGSYLKNRGLFKADTEQGVKFWSAVYIPIVVAMAAQQNVYGALSGGPMAILAGVAAVVLAFALLPVLDRIGRKSLRPSRPQPSNLSSGAGVTAMYESLMTVVSGYGLISGFALIGATMWLSSPSGRLPPPPRRPGRGAPADPAPCLGHRCRRARPFPSGPFVSPFPVLSRPPPVPPSPGAKPGKGRAAPPPVANARVAPSGPPLGGGRLRRRLPTRA